MLEFKLQKIQFEITDKQEDEIRESLEKAYGAFLLEKVKKELPLLLSWRNFIGEAETYMYTQGIPVSPPIVQQYAKAIYKEFIDNLEDSIQYSEEEKTLIVSPYISSLEFGDFYRPANKILSKIFSEFLEKNKLD